MPDTSPTSALRSPRKMPRASPTCPPMNPLRSSGTSFASGTQGGCPERARPAQRWGGLERTLRFAE
eukprot:13127111-Alexandrium_andersonii.AAC.1